MKYRDLFFDLDHTLWDFEKNARVVLQLLYREFDLAEKGIDNYFAFQKSFEKHNERFWERYRRGQINQEQLRIKRFWHLLLDFDIREYELVQAMSQRYLELLPEQTLLIPHTREVLDYCRSKGYRMHLLTNGFEPVQKVKVARSGIAPYFRHLITAQESGFLKPQPEIFAYALKTTGAVLEQSLMIGDALEADILGAKNFGMNQVFFNSRKIQHAEQPSYEIAELRELLQIL